MNALLNKVQSAIDKYAPTPPNAHILVGVSGGADSVSLLYALARLFEHPTHDNRTLSVAHLNHGIRPESTEDASFVKKLCNNLNIPFLTATVDVPLLAATTGVSLEMAARDARYKFFAETAQKCGANAVATAHNRDDQAETLLLKLCRGAGSAGLDGIAPNLIIQEFRVIRPLLDVSRREIESFLKEQNLTWHEDVTNADIKIKRNRIRHNILPQLEEHLNPRIKEALARTTSILREDNKYMEQQAKVALNESRIHPEHKKPPKSIRVHPCSSVVPSLKIESLRTLPLAILRRALRQWLIEYKTPADKIRFDTIERTIELILAEKGTGAITLTTNTEIRREYDLLHIIHKASIEIPIPTTELIIPGETRIDSHNMIITATPRTGFEHIQSGPIGKLPAEAVIRWDDSAPPEITVRSWLPGDRIHPIGMNGSCKLKEIFINAKVSQSERASIPIFVCNNEIIWIPGYRISSNRAVSDQHQQSLQLTITAEMNERQSTS